VDQLATRIKQALDASGRKHKDVAAAVGVAAETLSRWTTGNRRPSTQKIARLSQVLGRPVGWFYGDELTGVAGGDQLQRLEAALHAFREAVVAGEEPTAAWSRILGVPDVLTEAEQAAIRADPRGLRAYLEGPAGADWARLTEEQRRVVLDLIRLLANAPPAR
jgi:transcriptional regulator with XRE-family HTH domain